MFQNQIGSKESGLTVIEILAAIFIIGVSLSGLLGLVSFSLGVSNLAKQTTLADEFARETMEAVRNFRDGTIWNSQGLGTLTVGTAYHPEKTADVSPKWTLVSNQESIGIFIRKVVFEKVYRDGNDNIVASGTEDPNTKKVTVTVSWQERGRAHNVELVTYLTSWRR